MNTGEVHWIAFTVFLSLFLLVTVLGFLAARWKAGDMKRLDEWGLAGQRFGIIITWFLIGGDLYNSLFRNSLRDHHLPLRLCRHAPVLDCLSPGRTHDCGRFRKSAL
jgi:hypothetical protein